MTKLKFLPTTFAISLALSLVCLSDMAYAKAPETGSEAKAGLDAKAPERAVAQTYVVEKGDTLGAIAKEFLGNEDKWMVIARANEIEDPAKLEVGTRLVIPAESGESKSQGKVAPAPSHDSNAASKLGEPGR